jgi:cytochrome c oxidase subunit II
MNTRSFKLFVIALTLIVASGAAVLASRELLGNRAKGLLVVAVAHEWWWDFNYPSLGIFHSEELHLPIGTPIHFQFTTGDTFHSFWVPGLRHSVAIAPDRSSELDLTLPATGHFYGNCDAGCGCGSVCMRFPVFAETSAHFDQWVTASRTGKATPSHPARRSAPPCASGDSAETDLTPSASRLARLLR